MPQPLNYKSQPPRDDDKSGLIVLLAVLAVLVLMVIAQVIVAMRSIGNLPD